MCQDGPHARTDGGRSADTERQTYLGETGMKRVWKAGYSLACMIRWYAGMIVSVICDSLWFAPGFFLCLVPLVALPPLHCYLHLNELLIKSVNASETTSLANSRQSQSSAGRSVRHRHRRWFIPLQIPQIPQIPPSFSLGPP